MEVDLDEKSKLFWSIVLLFRKLGLILPYMLSESFLKWGVAMASGKKSTATNRVLSMFQEWDNGTKASRAAVLEDFVKHHQNQTGPELELEFAQAASLFFARITAWMRLRLVFPLIWETYTPGACDYTDAW